MRILSKGTTTSGYTVELAGEFDALGCTEIREELESIVENCKQSVLLLNLDKVTFIDSSGVGAIVFLYKRICAVEGAMEIIDVHGQPQELLSLLRVHEAIPITWASHEQQAV